MSIWIALYKGISEEPQNPKNIEKPNDHTELLHTALIKKPPRGLIPTPASRIPDTKTNFITHWEDTCKPQLSL